MRHNPTTHALVVALALASGPATSGCGGDKNKDTGSEVKASLGDFIAAGGPAPSGPFASLEFGMPDDAVKQAFPAFFENPSTYGESTVGRGEMGGFSASLELRDGLRGVSIDVPAAEAVPAMTAAWGQPVEIKRLGKTVRIWFDKAQATRATLTTTVVDETLQLTIEPILSYQALVERGGERIPFKPDAVLGATADELLERFPRYVKADTPDANDKAAEKMMSGLKADIEKKGIKLRTDQPKLDVNLPGTAFDDSDTLVILHYDDDNRVRSYAVIVEFDDYSAAGAQVIAAIEQAWGPSKKIKELSREHSWWFDADKGIRVKAEVHDARVELEYGRYLPLSRLFGEDGKVAWGFETTPILGAAVTDLQTAYPRLKVAADAGTATLDLPPTDYEGNTAMTRLLMFIDKDKGTVRSFSFDLSYEEYPPAKDEMLALLAKKFGDPKPTKDGRKSQYHSAPSVMLRDATITEKFELEMTP